MGGRRVRPPFLYMLTSATAAQAAPSESSGAGLSTAARGLVLVGATAIVVVVLIATKGYQPAAQATANGLVSGTYFALGAVGLALVFGVLRLVNFAHGDFLTFGAYSALLANAFFNLPIIVATAIAVAATAVLAAILELAVWRPMRARRAGGLQLLLIAIGLAFVIRNGIQIAAGTEPRTLHVDITSAVDRKIEALLSHKSQLPDPDGTETMVRGWTSAIAESAGLPEGRFAEAMRVVNTR